MKIGRYGVMVGLVAGLALVAPGLRAAEQNASTAQDSGAAMSSTSGEPTTPSSTAPVAMPAPMTAAPASSADAAASPAPALPAADTASTQPKAEPSADQIRQAIRDHIAEVVTDEGAFTIEDEQTGNVRALELVQVHEQPGKSGATYFVCTDMKDTASGELLDLDFDVEAVGDQLLVTDTRIHKVNGTARYTYDANNNRVPAAASTN